MSASDPEIWAEACRMAVEIIGRVNSGADLAVEMAQEFRGVMKALAVRKAERDALAESLKRVTSTLKSVSLQHEASLAATRLLLQKLTAARIDYAPECITEMLAVLAAAPDGTGKL
jgi:hypothetical protein